MEAEGYKKLYPELYLDTFVSAGVRPDGRTLGRGRAVTIGPGAVNAAQGSALVRLGHTSVLAGARASLMKPAEGTPDQGSLSIDVHFAPFATPQGARGAAAAELVSAVSERLQSCLRRLRLPQQLCIKRGCGAYAVEADVYVLNADGAVFDAVLLATLLMLRDLALPPTREVSPGSGEASGAGSGSVSSSHGSIRALTEEEASAAGVQPARLVLPTLPLAVTCCMYGPHLLVDPTAEEEAVAGATVTVVLDAQATLHGVYKSGGSAPATPMDFTRCVESAKLRYKELAQMIEQALAPEEEEQQ